MSDPVIVREGNQGNNGVAIAVILVVLIGLAIRAFASGRMQNGTADTPGTTDTKQVDVNVNTPSDSYDASSNDMNTPSDDMNTPSTME